MNQTWDSIERSDDANGPGAAQDFKSVQLKRWLAEGQASGATVPFAKGAGQSTDGTLGSKHADTWERSWGNTFPKKASDKPVVEQKSAEKILPHRDLAGLEFDKHWLNSVAIQRARDS